MGPGSSLETLKNDIANLIVGAKTEFARNPFDGSSQGRLKTLLDLQNLLSTQQISQSELALIREQVAQQMISQPHAQSNAPPTPVPMPVRQVALPPSAPAPFAQSSGPNDLAALLSASSRQNSTPHPQISPTPPPTTSAKPDPTSLIEQLRAAGILPGASSSSPALPKATTTSTTPLSQIPYVGNNLPPRQALADLPNDVQLKVASLKM